MPEQKFKKQSFKNVSSVSDNYLYSLDRQPVELHIDYGNTVLKLEGIIKTKARFDVILEFEDDDGELQKLIINKAYIIMVRPLPH